MPEYALLLFAVLISAAAAVKRIGPRVYIAGNVSTRLLLGEDVTVDGVSGSAVASVVTPDPGSAANNASSGSSGTASSASGSGGSSVGSGGAGGGGGESSVGSGSSAGGGGGGGSSIASSGSSVGGGILNGGGVVLGATGSQPASAGGGSATGSSGSGSSSAGAAADALLASAQKNAGGGESSGGLGSSAPSPASQAANSDAPASTPATAPLGFLGGTGASQTTSGSQNTVNPAPSTQGDGYTVSAQGQAQMQALLAQAKANADGKRPLGHCYHVVKEDIDEVGYGGLTKQGDSAFPKQIPGSNQEYAHQFADYMNATAANGHTNADNLGLQKLPITNPYDAPPGSIIVVRAGTPGTRNPVAGDIVVAGGNGKFYNDGNMGYGGSKNFPAGNNYVIGIYAPK